MVHDMDNLTFSAGIRAFPLLAYVDNPKENDGFSVRVCRGVASYMMYTVCS